MDAGKLDTRISLLSYGLPAPAANQVTPNTADPAVYAWTTSGGAWAMVEWKDKVVYSPYAIGQHGIKATVRRQPITPAAALSMAGQHYVIASVEDLPRERYLIITAAAMTPVLCVADDPTITYDSYNRPVYGTPTALHFYGVLSERYMDWFQDRPNAELTQTQILTVPKAIVLASGQTVTVGSDVYAVTRCYLTDPYRNDYELVRKEDA